MITSLKDLYNLLISGQKDGDILEYLGYDIKNAVIDVDYYKKKINSLPEGKYVISDLDGTFYRGFTIELTINYFVEYVKSLYILKVNDIEYYKSFIEDFYYFEKFRQKAINREIDFMLYLDIGVYFLYKYIDKFDYRSFVNYLNDNLYIKFLVNPYKFSIKFLLIKLQQGFNFMFVSGASNFILDLYVELLKSYIKQSFNFDFSSKIFGFGSFSDFENRCIYNLWTYDQKKSFIEDLKRIKKIKVLYGMGDTVADFGIADNLDENGEFYFVNPDYKVIQEFSKYKKNYIKYHFINERKGYYFEYFIDKIKFFEDF